MYDYDSRDSRPARLADNGLVGGRVLPLCASRARRALAAPFTKVLNQRFAYTFTAFAVIASKIVHIVAQERGLPRRHLALWSFSFVAQDLILLVGLRLMIEWADSQQKKNALLRVLVKTCAMAILCFAAFVSVINITFFSYARSEVRWRNVGFAKDPSSRGVLMSASATLLVVVSLLTAISVTFQNGIFEFARVAIDVIEWPWKRLMELRNGRKRAPHQYSELPQATLPDEFDDDKTNPRSAEYSIGRACNRFSRILWSVAIISQIVSYIFRPSIGSLTYMSWTAPLVPFVDFKVSVSNLKGLHPVYDSGIGHTWDNKTALSQPPPFDWLPRDTVLAGFEDWYETGGNHYNAAADPLKISNLDQELLPELREALGDVSIKHIVLVLLESTRKDLFPVKKDDLVWNRFTEAQKGQPLSDEAVKRLQSLTPTANYLTGDYDDGFSHSAKSSRGGLNFNDAYTAATYTLKSTLATMCGIWPLVADLNMEYLHHIYQPCLPQILEALSVVDQENATTGSAAAKWSSHFLQSITMDYDNGDIGTRQFGFPSENIVDSGYLRSDAAKFGKVELPDVNYFGFQEQPLLDYFHDIFASAKKAKERVFLTHITSTTHHPYTMPANETNVPLGNGRLQQLSDYVNSIGYDDRWLAQILNVLDEEAVADETLVIFVGDHGISLPENDKPASYYNPNTGCNRVPLVLSHPKLPVINVDGPVSSMEILPTILDLLRETGSLSDAANAAAGDLLANYEGQSLIRKLRNSAPAAAETPVKPMETDTAGHGVLGNWQFIVMNPGRAMVGIRDKRRQHWRLVAPVLKNVAWTFNDLETDPRDLHPTESFDFASFLRDVEKRHGVEQARWAEEAAFIARWFVDENNKRWRYGEYAVPTADSAAASA
ncbi:hypothetical protein K4F52_001100 [Lecanicillium sp. MT-2017a]|nr:hypothetical protein K4F52_001100 [Lecanicillium sp. MT-2017a]